MDEKNNQNVLEKLNNFEGKRKSEKSKQDTLKKTGIVLCVLAFLSSFVIAMLPIFIMMLDISFSMDDIRNHAEPSNNAFRTLIKTLSDYIMHASSEATFAFIIGCIIIGSIFFLFAMLCFRSAKKHKNAFKNNLKKECFNDALKTFGDIQWFEHDQLNINEESKVGLDTDVLNRSALFGNFTNRMIDDEFKGSHNGINFEISETHMWYHSGRAAINVFKGIIIQFDSNKKVLNRTMVSTKGDLTRKNTIWITAILFFMIFLNTIETCIRSKSVFPIYFLITVVLIVLLINLFVRKKEEALDRVTLEDTKFNERFDVYSSDQVEARYLVTPSFMERLNKIQTAFGTRKVKCSFFDNKFMIAISTKKDLFEIGKINNSLKDSNNIEAFHNEMTSIYDMIDYFKLDEKTGL